MFFAHRTRAFELRLNTQYACPALVPERGARSLSANRRVRVCVCVLRVRVSRVGIVNIIFLPLAVEWAFCTH